MSTEPIPVATVWDPPEADVGRVTIVGSGWAPNVPVITKWNNAFGFPDNGEGANSIKLQSPVPDANGRFAFETIHRGVARPAAEWYWDGNVQLVHRGPPRPGRHRELPHRPPALHPAARPLAVGAVRPDDPP